MRARLLGLLALLATLCLGGVALADGFGGGGGGGAASRRVAPDTNDLAIWTLDETSPPWANSGTQASCSLTLSSVGTGSFLSRLGIFSTGFDSGGGGTNYSSAHGCATLEPTAAGGITVSAWLYPRTFDTGYNPIIAKSYRVPGTWTAPYMSIGIETVGSGNGTVQAVVALAATLYACASSGVDKLTLNAWNYVGMTYDGANIKLYLNGNLVNTCAQAGSIDYGTHGDWQVDTLESGAGQGVNGVFDDPRVSNIARPASYFKTVWSTATGFGQ